MLFSPCRSTFETILDIWWSKADVLSRKLSYATSCCISFSFSCLVCLYVLYFSLFFIIWKGKKAHDALKLVFL